MEGEGRTATVCVILACALEVFPNRVKLWEGQRISNRATAPGFFLVVRSALLTLKIGNVGRRYCRSFSCVAHTRVDGGWYSQGKRFPLISMNYADSLVQIWMKGVGFERQQGQLDTVPSTLEEAIAKFSKPYMMIQGQIH